MVNQKGEAILSCKVSQIHNWTIILIDSLMFNTLSEKHIIRIDVQLSFIHEVSVVYIPPITVLAPKIGLNLISDYRIFWVTQK